jgi:hypothetical protein
LYLIGTDPTNVQHAKKKNDHSRLHWAPEASIPFCRAFISLKFASNDESAAASLFSPVGTEISKPNNLVPIEPCELDVDSRNLLTTWLAPVLEKRENGWRCAATENDGFPCI